MKRLIPLLILIAPLPAWAQLEGVIDLHVHSAPDSRPRSIDALEAARMARRNGMRALVFKNHYTHTASLAYLVAQAVPGIEIYGGIALNRSVGGINPAAIEHFARTTGRLGRVVWLPTFDSEHNHLTVTPNPDHVPVARNGELLPAVREVLGLIADHGLSLATGHSSPEETLLIIREARGLDIDRIIVTHPASPLSAMSPETQKEAARLGALLEYPIALALPTRELGFAAFGAQIREVGPEHVALSTDLGQVLNPVHTDGLNAFLPRLREAGFSQTEIDVMTKSNPARFLGLD
jgi:hypothetical protein